MWLVLCDSTDASALWAAQGLKAGGLEPLEVVSAERLAQSQRWEHRVGAKGVTIDITQADGRRIRNDTFHGVLNRLVSVPYAPLLLAHPADREYASQELTAFFLSWLHALSLPVINRPTPQGLAGQWRHRSEWLWLAAHAGLSTPCYRQTSQDSPAGQAGQELVMAKTPLHTVFIVAGQVIGANVPAHICSACQRLAELAQTTLLGVDFTDSLTGPWTFASATPIPDLRLGGGGLARCSGQRAAGPAEVIVMILLCGISSEIPFAMVREQLDQRDVPHALFNQRGYAGMAMEFEIMRGHISGRLQIEGHTYRLEDFGGVYIRLMDDQQLPEISGEPVDSATRRSCRALHATLLRWSELAPTRVVNRTAAMALNSSKPYETQLIREHGFAVPETLITNDPDLVRAFHQQHWHVIYKSISGVRSIVYTLEAEDFARLDCIRWCPTQFQAFVEGTNVRVHTIGSTLFATAIYTQATDYRYARRQGSDAALQAIELPDALAERCLRLAQALGLVFAGIDLKLMPDHQVYCFEVNPSPAFSYYEAHTGQPIAQAVARYLSGELD